MQRGAPAPEGWEERAREAFLDGYFETVDPALLPPGQEATAQAARRSSSSRRRSTSCATSSTTGPTGSRIPVAGHRRGCSRRRGSNDATDADHRREHARPARLPRRPSRRRRRRRRPRVPARRRERSRVLTPTASRAELERVHPDGAVRGRVPKARSCRSPTSSRSTTARTGTFTVERPVPLPADARRARPAPRRRGPPRGALRARSARTCASIEGVRGHRVRGLGAGRAVGLASSATSTPGTGACTRCARSARAGSGSCSCPASATARRYKYEILDARTASCRLQGRPVRVRDRAAAQDRVGRPRARRTSGRDAAWLEQRAQAPPLDGPMSIYEVHLGSWRLNPLEDNRSLTYLELADELAAYAQGHGLHPRRAAAGHGAPVHAARGATR